MELRPFYEGSEDEGWYCPCCRSSLRTAEMMRAGWERRAAALGMTWDEYREHMDAEAAKWVRKPTDRDMKEAQAFVKRMAREWKPVCVHDTNPWGDTAA